MDGLQSSLDAANKDLEEIKAKVRKFQIPLITRSESCYQLVAAESEAVSKTERVAELEDQLKLMAEDNETAKREIDALKAASSESADANAAAAVEHEALLKARADLEAIKSETAALTAAHDAAIQEAQAKIQELEGAAARNAELEEQIAHLKTEKEHNELLAPVRRLHEVVALEFWLHIPMWVV